MENGRTYAPISIAASIPRFFDRDFRDAALVLDTGGTTTGITVLAGEQVDPSALEAPSDQLRHRLLHGKLTWIGAETTPLEYLATEVPVGGVSYPVIPRGVPFSNVSVLLGLVDEARLRKLSLFGRSPLRETALRALADAVNLDLAMTSEQSLLELAEHFRELAVDRLATGIRRALETAPPDCRSQALAFGLGAAGLTRPALARAGLPREGIHLGHDHLPTELAELASCYGACVAGMEILTGETLEVPST